MKISSIGGQRNRGEVIAFNGEMKDYPFEPSRMSLGELLEMVGWTRPGRRYRVSFTPSDVVAMLFALPPGELALAISKAGKNRTDEDRERLTSLLHELIDVALKPQAKKSVKPRASN